jgi:hypothetical protein
MSDDDKKPYCGIGKIPKNKKQGSIQDCAEAKQIRKYGLEKVEREEIQTKKDQRNEEKQKLLISVMKNKLSKLIKKIKDEKNEEKKNDLKEEAKKVLRELNDLKSRTKNKIDKVKVEKKIDPYKGSKIDLNKLRKLLNEIKVKKNTKLPYDDLQNSANNVYNKLLGKLSKEQVKANIGLSLFKLL